MAKQDEHKSYSATLSSNNSNDNDDKFIATSNNDVVLPSHNIAKPSKSIGEEQRQDHTTTSAKQISSLLQSQKVWHVSYIGYVLLISFVYVLTDDIFDRVGE